MPEFHAEPYIYLPAVTHKSALIAWGAFYFRVTNRGAAKLVDDQDLKFVHPATQRLDRRVLGAVRTGAGGGARRRAARWWLYGQDRGHQPLLGDGAAARHRIHLSRVRERGGVGRRRAVGLVHHAAGARPDRRAATTTGSARIPIRRTPAPLTFAVIGDFGVGMQDVVAVARRQQQVADALRQAVDREGVRLILTTGDNIYASKKLFGIPMSSQRRRGRRLVLHLLPALSLHPQPHSRCIRRSAITTPTRPRRATTARR